MVRIKPFLRPQQLRAALTPTPTTQLLSPLQATLQQHQQKQQQQRHSSSSTTAPAPAIPSPTPFIPDVNTFLTVIGRGLSSHASKFPSWDALFSLTSDQLRELGVEPPRTRRYLLQWRQRFRRGQYGVGGDLQHVSDDGAATLAVWEAPAADKTSAARPRKYVVNVPEGRKLADCSLDEISRVRGYKVQGAKTIVGPYALPLAGGEGARVAVTEGMWEDRRGHKIDGGERRQAEIRYKKRVAERREMRERGEL
ncbi:IGR protein motif-domain-containing protein [Annulohypoxylon truncatum]|uniref:IGR protein motif-domain-containing protein n=1 Tax=Annulohypoxylon truncatum TaxID=327061 RepID=UPI0020079938|nr:IGR protein motif-domain-containing protein [Annulohypoxylon truncatum]KAI1214916.1 IGR protein motif-domain-containing protein [Annulohypoxylon truncatum]